MTNIDVPAEGLPPVYQVHLPLSTATITLVTKAIRTWRTEVKSRWRKLPDQQAALLILAVLRHDQRPQDLARSNGISALTLRRWTIQALTVLARQAPRLDRVLTNTARRRGTDPVLLLDGTCLPVHTPTGRREKAFWCPKHRAHHIRVLTLTDQHGRLLWTSAATGAGTHETRQAKRLNIPARLRHHDLAIICDRYHTRLDDQPANPTVITGRRACRNHKLTPAEKQINKLLATERATNEHAHAHLKNWRGTTRLRHGWMRNNATTLIRALLVLTNTEINR
jgi:hypothetical protein